MKVYILYQTDAWNSHESEQVLAICSRKSKAVVFAGKNAHELGEELSVHDLEMLEEIGQTQGRENNYLIEPITVDEY